jgi:formate hydrogenlyase transcriptional activator
MQKTTIPYLIQNRPHSDEICGAIPLVRKHLAEGIDGATGGCGEWPKPKPVIYQRQSPISAPGSDSEIYQALFDLSQAIADASDLETLCNSLANTLRRVVSFDPLGLCLYDPVHDRLSLHAVSANRPYRQHQVDIRADSDDVGARVWRDQQPLVLSHLDQDARVSGVSELLRDGIQALTIIPLTNGDRRLGIIVFGFSRPFQPDEEELTFLQRVASEVAVSVDGYLTRQALLHERDRMRVLFDVTNALVSKLPLDKLFMAISEQLRSVVEHDIAAVTLLDKATGEIHVSGLHSPGSIHFVPSEAPVRPEGIPAGEVLATGEPVVTDEPDFDRFPSPLYHKYMDLGIRSECAVPLSSRKQISGVLELARKSGEPFTSDEVDLLVQVARQIAIAVDNSLAYRELSQLKDKLASEKLYLEDEIRFDQNVGNMIGGSPAFEAVLRGIRVVAPTDATVLIEGETGTGKELVARAIHDLSARSKRSFIKVNCAAIPATLLESELFGHEKGSFTGAFAQRVGRFEMAHQGTLFLDEVGEIPLELQSKLLRAIQEQELERVGGSRTIRVDVRFIAATNRNLKQMVDEGKFRGDLYYRLHVFPLVVPALRERKEDIPLLIRFFTEKYAKRMNRSIESIPQAAIDALTNYEWPGNVRELQNVIERSVILSPGRVLKIALPTPLSSKTPYPNEAVERRERILQALQECGGRVAGPNGAAVRLGLKRSTLQSRMKKLHIERQYK